jgi:hypothetical protein
VVNGPDNQVPVGSSVHDRLAEIEHRLLELRQIRERLVARPEVPVITDPSVAGVQVARERVVQALRRVAQAHDQAAEIYERSVRTGIGDIAAHRRWAAFHRSAAETDRKRAQEIHDRAWSAAS